MIIQIEKNISKEQQAVIFHKIQSLDYQGLHVQTQSQNLIVCVGKKEFDIREIAALSGVRDVHRVLDGYKLVSHQWKQKSTSIDLGDGVRIDDQSFSIMAGPCSIENEAQIENVIQHLAKNKVKIMRGGVFKPRSSPYSFRGLGMDGLKMFHQLCKENHIKIITEVMEINQLEAMYDYVDIFQVGSRNSQNFNLLDGLGEVDKPVLIKRGISGTIEELIQSAEYVYSKGNERILLCERGIRSYEKSYRNTFDVNAIPILKQKTHLPVIADPSHGVGLRRIVPAIALASVAAGADGVIYEVHAQPEKAFSDGQQTLDFNESSKLIRQLRRLHATIKNKDF